MVTRLTSLLEVADRFEAIVLDQWGVLHDGTAPYPGALDALDALSRKDMRLAVLSNSGKRATPNAERIRSMGFNRSVFDVVMTSGEALWADIAVGDIAAQRFFAIERAPGDALHWAKGLPVFLSQTPASADAILLMGLPDHAVPDRVLAALDTALKLDMPVYCTNPDRVSPRADGVRVTSPGALAHAHLDAGGQVTFYGKPHLPVYRAVETALNVAPEKLLMVGDSLEHDIAGGHAAGWSTAFVEGGLHAGHFRCTDSPLSVLSGLSATEGTDLPTFSLPILR